VYQEQHFTLLFELKAICYLDR